MCKSVLVGINVCRNDKNGIVWGYFDQNYMNDLYIVVFVDFFVALSLHWLRQKLSAFHWTVKFFVSELFPNNTLLVCISCVFPCLVHVLSLLVLLCSHPTHPINPVF